MNFMVVGVFMAMGVLSRLFHDPRKDEPENGLLTGMGRDGAKELKLLKDKGAVTFAQDRESSVVHGMPGAAIQLDAATLVLPAERIAAALAGLAKDRG